MKDVILGGNISDEASFSCLAQDKVSLLLSSIKDWTEKVYYMHQRCIFLVPYNEEQGWVLLFGHPWPLSTS